MQRLRLDQMQSMKTSSITRALPFTPMSVHVLGPVLHSVYCTYSAGVVGARFDDDVLPTIQAFFASPETPGLYMYVGMWVCGYDAST